MPFITLSLPLFSSPLACLLVGLSKNCSTDCHKIQWKGNTWTCKKPLDFGCNRDHVRVTVTVRWGHHHSLHGRECVTLHSNGHFPGEPGLAGVYWSKGWWRWRWQLNYWSYKSCKAPVKLSPPTNQHVTQCSFNSNNFVTSAAILHTNVCTQSTNLQRHNRASTY